MDVQAGFQQRLATALKGAAPMPDTDPTYGRRVENRARRHRSRQRRAIPAGAAGVALVATGGYLLRPDHSSSPTNADPGSPTHSSPGLGGVGPACMPASLSPGGPVRISARVGQPLTVDAHLEGQHDDWVRAEQLVVMPPGYQPEAPGEADNPHVRLAASNRLTRVRPAGQPVTLTWTPTRAGRYPLIDVGSGVCDPAQGVYRAEGNFGVIIVR
jgi:hypothetical protein